MEGLSSMTWFTGTIYIFDVFGSSSYDGSSDPAMWFNCVCLEDTTSRGNSC